VNYTTLITAEQLQSLMGSGAPLMVFDCSFELMKPEAGDQQFAEAHIPGAVRANLDRHLSAQAGAPSASRGRHPLPTREDFALWLGSVGFANNMQAVVYDRQGANYCGRLWWMLKWTGHEAVAALNGGLEAWYAAGGVVTSGAGTSHAPQVFRVGEERAALATTRQVADRLGRPTQNIIDARASARYRGEVEPLDPVAGHIPGALNRPFGSNIAPMAASNQRPCCARSSWRCWPAATRQPSSTIAAVASAPCPTSLRWSSPASAARRSTQGAGASGAATPSGHSPRADRGHGLEKPRYLPVVVDVDA